MMLQPPCNEFFERFNEALARMPEQPPIDLDAAERLKLSEAFTFEVAAFDRLVAAYLTFQEAQQIRRHLSDRIAS